MKNTGILLAAALAGLLLVTILTSDVDREPELAPDFTLMNLDGDFVTLGDYRGSIVVLDFWATWCSPCIKSFPTLHAVVERNEDEGVVLLLVSLDKTAKRPRDYLVTNGYSTDNVLWESLDAAREVKTLFGVVGIPRTFLIDRNGFIQFAGHPSELTDERLREWF